MKMITVPANENGTERVCVNKTVIHAGEELTEEKTVTYRIPAGVEIAVDDDLFDAAIQQYHCRAGFFVDSEDDIADLPTSGIADGSYAFVMDGQTVKFLSNGAWV